MQNPTQRFPGDRQASGERPGDGPTRPPARTLRERRRQLKQTQEEAAAALGVSLSTYQRWERAAQHPHLPAQRRLAAHFGVDYADLDRWFPAAQPVPPEQASPETE
jgi:transcriptional regulator with XRE-family HTH domain